MSEVIVNLIDLNEDINYSSFVTIFCSYLITLWLVISVWVGVDAFKRFNNKLIAFTFFLLTFFLNFPILIFYFIVRPEFKYDDFQEWETGGVNVPIVNFKGKDGTVAMVLELKMNPLNIATEQSDMKIDVAWESRKENFTLQASKADSQDLEDGMPPRADRKISTTFRNFSGIVAKKIERIKEISAVYVKKTSKNISKGKRADKKSVKKNSKKPRKNNKNKRSKGKKK